MNHTINNNKAILMYTAIYPEIEELDYQDPNAAEGWFTLQLATRMRKQDTEGTWYLQLIIERVYYFKPKAEKQAHAQAYKRMMRAAHMCQVLGVVEKSMLEQFSPTSISIDPDQRSEADRLKDRYIPKRREI